MLLCASGSGMGDDEDEGCASGCVGKDGEKARVCVGICTGERGHGARSRHTHAATNYEEKEGKRRKNSERHKQKRRREQTSGESRQEL
eukprot:1551753-Rhodomonas_salina.2